VPKQIHPDTEFTPLQGEAFDDHDAYENEGKRDSNPYNIRTTVDTFPNTKVNHDPNCDACEEDLPTEH
jgi:hypothetical protein